MALAAATAGWMYLDAKYFLSHDLGLVKGGFIGARMAKRLQDSDRLNFFYVLEEHALNPKQGDRLYLIYQGRMWTYRQFYDMALRYGQWLKKTHGVVPDEIVALDCMNRP